MNTGQTPATSDGSTNSPKRSLCRWLADKVATAVIASSVTLIFSGRLIDSLPHPVKQLGAVLSDKVNAKFKSGLSLFNSHPDVTGDGDQGFMRNESRADATVNRPHPDGTANKPDVEGYGKPHLASYGLGGGTSRPRP